MCEIVDDLKKVADRIIKLEHEDLDIIFTNEDNKQFVNAVMTLQEHARYITQHYG